MPAGFNWLQTLDVKNTQLTMADVNSLLKTFPVSHLKVLDMSYNILTCCVQVLVSTLRECKALEELYLVSIGMTAADVSSLIMGLGDSALHHLKTLNLSGNVLTDCIGALLNGSVLPNLSSLYIAEAQLSTNDMKSLFARMSTGKLPGCDIFGPSHK